MDQPKIHAEVNLDLRPPGPGESRESVLPRCLEGANDIIFLVRTLQKRILEYPEIESEIFIFLREMKRFFEPDLPSKLHQALNEWQGEFGEPAA